ncbi:class I SAM-dependent methyltransferase [Kordiimonas aestuarii]|uniref:class I SAM-dependent methyltransferase n=1 Tax=Kordiimonas aestuarii TaxID=1005925 RepID=UPI0021D24DFF|nr:class I SAM-dependent methyltransferase [Kordiimonas aestuarii]
MKRTTIVGITDESLIHPPEIFAELSARQRLAEASLLKQQNHFIQSNCPACAAAKREFAFARSGFSFQSCQVCQTLYMSPRPTANMLHEYYEQSDYGRFIQSADHETALAPFRKDQARKQADKLIPLLQKSDHRENGILLLAPKHTMLAEVLAADAITPVHSKPAPWHDDVDPQGDRKYAIAAAFDIFERLPDPGTAIAKVYQQLSTNGHLILSVRSGSGYDLLTLWQHSDLKPAEHMNLFTVEGMSLLMERAGFSVGELSTPGHLDLQIVKRIRAQKHLKLDRFTEYFLNNRNDFASEQFQGFLQKSLLSSHMLAVGVKN